MARSPSPRKKTPESATPKSKGSNHSSAHHNATDADGNLVTPREHLEFGGLFGTFLIPYFLPCVVFFLYHTANPKFVLTFSNIPELFETDIWTTVKFPSQQAIGIVVSWFLFQVFLERVLPKEVVEGTKLSTGERLKYNVNGHLAYWVSLIVLLHCYPVFDAKTGKLAYLTRFPLEYIYDNFVDLAGAAILFSWVLALGLYIKSFAKGALLAVGGNSGYPTYDFFIGRELNPRWGDFDWKEFCELRPGLIGWMVINLGCAAAQYRDLGHVTIPMILVNAFQAMYVWDALYSETAILTTMDITTDGFGFMLAFGDLAWVPFTYSLQARFLVTHSPDMPLAFWAFVAAVKIAGFMIFRGANGEKNQFRLDPSHPSVSHLKFIQTQRGTKLMISGWWGMARKINYTGDWLMGLAWCMTTGFQTPVTYFYAIYFGILLVHRALRDNHACLLKYGEKDWNAYKKAVPYMFFPGVF